MNEGSSENRDSLEELEKKLYRRGESTDFEKYRSHLSHSREEAKKSVIYRRPEPQHANSFAQGAPSGMSLGAKALIAGGFFFLVAFGIAAYYFFAGGNVVSADNIEVIMEGPVSVRGGDPFALTLQFKNNNRSDLEYSNMTVEFPEGTRTPADPTKELLRYDESVGSLHAGEIAQKKVTALLYGDENEKKEIKITLFYKPKDSSATFKKEASYTVSISSSPVAISFTLPREVNSGQPLDFDVKVTSNNKETLRNLLVDVAYPPGFEYSSASAPLFSGTHTWRFDSLAPGREIALHVSGALAGQDEEQKAFRVTVGTASATDSTKVVVPYGSATRVLAIKRPFLGVSLTGVSSLGEIRAIPDGGSFTGVFHISNNLAENLDDFTAQLKITGDSFVPSTVVADGGFFRSTQSQIEWNKTTNEGFATIEAGRTLDLGFAFDTKSSASGGKVGHNREISYDLTVTGSRDVAGVGREPVTTHFVKTIPISSVLGFTERAVYSVGPFTNTGPIPPKANETTTYTVIWTLTNSANNLSGTKVSAKLPTYVEWLGAVKPSTETVSFDQGSRTVSWDVGALPAGVGYGSAGREVAFQIALTPSVTQQNSEPNIVGEAAARALDDFTNVPLESIKRELTTNIASDPRFLAGQGAVR